MKCVNCDNDATFVDNTPSVNSVVYCSACSPKHSPYVSAIVEQSAPVEDQVVEEVVRESNPSTGKTRASRSTNGV